MEEKIHNEQMETAIPSPAPSTHLSRARTTQMSMPHTVQFQRALATARQRGRAHRARAQSRRGRRASTRTLSSLAARRDACAADRTGSWRPWPRTRYPRPRSARRVSETHFSNAKPRCRPTEGLQRVAIQVHSGARWVGMHIVDLK